MWSRSDQSCVHVWLRKAQPAFSGSRGQCRGKLLRMTTMFDDSRLDDPAALDAHREEIEWLALTGARVRRDAASADFTVLDRFAATRPRAVIAVGPEGRLIRAVVEPTCPVPFVAWPAGGLPGWVGPLDLVIALDGDPVPVTAAMRRGALVVAVCPDDSQLFDRAAGSSVELIPTTSDDPFVAAVIALSALERFGLGPSVRPAEVADGLDAVAADCGPCVDLGANPAKAVACALAETVPLLWGGTTLSARASRRIAEAIRRVTGAPALAADAPALLPVLAGARRRDLFADPDDVEGLVSLVILDDDGADPLLADQQRTLRQVAESRGVPTPTITYDRGGLVERYACLLLQGLYAAAYVGVASV